MSPLSPVIALQLSSREQRLPDFKVTLEPSPLTDHIRGMRDSDKAAA